MSDYYYLEADEQDAVHYIVKLAGEISSMADDVAVAFDQWPEHWRPDQLPDMERAHYAALQFRVLLGELGLMEKPDANG